MTVVIRGNKLCTASLSNNTGIFTGQNVQDNWDSITADKNVSGFTMGDFSTVTAGISYYLGTARNWQSVYDADIKGNVEVRRVR